MVQEQIVEYINTQMKLGTSRDTIKTTLTGAGWQAVDVEDTLKKIESAKASQPGATMAVSPASPAGPKPAEPFVISSKPMTPAGGSANPAPQTIKVSDLVSSSSAMSASTPSKPPATPSRSPMTGPAMPATSAPNKPTDSFQATSYPGVKPHTSRGPLITEIILVVIILAVGGLAGFLYMQNSSLSSQLKGLSGQSTGVNSQLAALQAQVAASTTALTAQVASLNAETQDLQTELSFYAAPSSTTAGATSTATFGGTVSGGGKTPYIITVTYGAKVYVSNSKSAGVIAALTPLMATATTTAASAEFSGVYVPGSDEVAVTEVNGTAVQ